MVSPRRDYDPTQAAIRALEDPMLYVDDTERAHWLHLLLQESNIAGEHNPMVSGAVDTNSDETNGQHGQE